MTKGWLFVGEEAGRQKELGHGDTGAWVPWTEDGKKRRNRSWEGEAGEVVSIHTLAPHPSNELHVWGRLPLSSPKKESLLTRFSASFFYLNSSSMLWLHHILRIWTWSYQTSGENYFMSPVTYNIISKLWILNAPYDVATAYSWLLPQTSPPLQLCGLYIDCLE